MLAVTREDDFELHQLLRVAGVEIVTNPLAGRGMGASIARGVNASPDSAGWCILPADMPCVMPSTTWLVIRALRGGAALAAPFYRGRRGHPVGFHCSFQAPLGRLDGETGARTLLEQHAQQLLAVDVDDASVIRDIDTPLQLAAANHR